jgi:hypothetical protein
MSTRLLVAALGASAVIAVVIGIGLYLTAVATLGWGNIPQDAFDHSMFFFLLFGWPFALVVTVIAGAVGITLVERRSRRLTLSAVVPPAALLGAVVAPLVWAVI